MTFQGLSQSGAQVLPLSYLWITPPESQGADRIPHHFPEVQVSVYFCIQSCGTHPCLGRLTLTVFFYCWCLFQRLGFCKLFLWSSVYFLYPWLSEKPSFFLLPHPSPCWLLQLFVGSRQSLQFASASHPLLSTWQQHYFPLPPQWVIFLSLKHHLLFSHLTWHPNLIP